VPAEGKKDAARKSGATRLVKEKKRSEWGVCIFAQVSKDLSPGGPDKINRGRWRGSCGAGTEMKWDA